MNIAEIEKIIETEIPIVKSMGISFQKITRNECTISVPLEPNHNHKNTAFGGSLYSVCTAACYGLMFALQREDQLMMYDLVIGEGSIRYNRPVDKDFFVTAKINPDDWKTLTEKISRSGFGKIPLTATVTITGQALCDYKATFILMGKRA